MTTSLLLVAGFTFLLDQVSKQMVRRLLAEGEAFPARAPMRLRRVANPRLGIGLIKDRRVLFALWGAILLTILMIVPRTFLVHDPLALIGFGLALGGATGNLCDWLRDRSIVDFIDLRIWPVFNLADAAIVLGLGCIYGSML